MKEIIETLKNKNETISTMESCTGGGIANYITNFEGASYILKFSAVTYSNEYKIKMGVDKNIIDTYSVYSIETAHEMAKNISKFTNSTYGIGITGQLNRYDPFNKINENNIVYVSIYNSINNKFYDEKIKVEEKTRSENKEIIIEKVICLLKDVINNN